MHFAEARGIGKPRQNIPKRADRKLDHHLAVARVIFMREHQRRGAGVVERPNFHAEAHVKALGRAYDGALDVALEQDVPGIEIAQPYPPATLFSRRQHHSGA